MEKDYGGKHQSGIKKTDHQIEHQQIINIIRKNGATVSYFSNLIKLINYDFLENKTIFYFQKITTIESRYMFVQVAKRLKNEPFLCCNSKTNKTGRALFIHF